MFFFIWSREMFVSVYFQGKRVICATAKKKKKEEAAMRESGKMEALEGSREWRVI